MSEAVPLFPRRSLQRELLLAFLVYSAFLGLAVISPYAQGSGLMRRVIWDPVTLYTFRPSDEVVRRSLAAGYFPLWDNSRGLGVPHVMPSGLILDYPLKAILYFLPTRTGEELYLLLRFLLAGVGCFLSARAAGLRFAGALLAGLSYMLCGYFCEYQNQETMNVEAVFPLVVFFLLRTARRWSLTPALGAVLTGYFLAHNPESTVYALLYCFSCFLFVGLGLPSGRSLLFTLFASCLLPAALILLGFLARADSILCFLEYHHHGWIFHPQGLGELAFSPRTVIAFVTPIFAYWLATPLPAELSHFAQLSLIPAYLGIFSFLLSLLALSHFRRLPSSALFFCSAAIILAGLIFGLPPFNFLAQLPLFRYFQNFRYAQPYLIHALSLLAGWGLELILRRQIRPGVLPLTAGLSGLWILVHLLLFRERFLHSEVVRTGLMAALLLAVILSASTFFFLRRFRQHRPLILAASLITGTGLELALYFNLAFPLFGPQAFNLDLPPAALSLARQPSSPSRLISLDKRLLHPNLAGTAGLSDLRDHSPLSVKDYALLFARANGWESDEEMRAGFLAQGKFYFDVDLHRWPPRLLDLLNVRWVFTYETPEAEELLPPWAELALLSPAPDYVQQMEVTVGGVFRSAYFLHAPARLQGRFKKPSAALAFHAALLENASKCPETDGINLIILRGTQTLSLVYARHLHAPQDTTWKPITPFPSSQEESLIFAALPGPRDDRQCDFGLISRPEILPGPDSLLQRHRLRLHYHQECRLYENEDVLPRVFSVEEVRTMEDKFEFLSALHQEDPAKTAWTDSPAAFAPVSFAPGRVDKVKEGIGRLEFEMEAPGPAAVVISNLYFPGWRAWRGEEEIPVRRVNGLMQGLQLPPGHHQLLLAYLPLSFKIALWIRLVSFSLLLLVLLFRALFPSSSRPPPSSTPTPILSSLVRPLTRL